MDSEPISSIEVDSLVILRIVESLNGILLGVEQDSHLIITNAFKTANTSKMLEHLDKLNYESNVVGRYSSTKDLQTQVQEQYEFQQEYPNGVYFYYQQSPPKLYALRLSQKFMATGMKNITGKLVKEHGLTPSSIFESIPVTIKNSFMTEALNIQIMTDLVESDLVPVQKTVENQLEELIEAVEDQGQEYWRWQTWHRTFQKELKATKSTGADSAKASPTEKDLDGEATTPTTTPALNKVLAAEPNRLETLVLAYEIDKHAQDLLQFAA